MKSMVKLPLYLGLAVFVVAVIISAVKVGNQQAFTNLGSRANVSGASLVLKYTAPDLVGVILTSEKDVSGVDVSLKYNSDKIVILPSTLVGGPDFVTSGGNIDEKSGIFAFSAISQKREIVAGLVASFTVKSKTATKTDGDIQFDKSTTTVIDKAAGQNILTQTQGVKFSLPQ